MNRILLAVLMLAVAAQAQLVGVSHRKIFTPSSQVSTPTFSPAAGTYSSTQTVTISTATSLAVLCYTTDGSTPTETANLCLGGTTSTYSTPISVATTQTVKAIGTKALYTDSAVGNAAYTISAAAPTIVTGSGGTAYTASTALGSALASGDWAFFHQLNATDNVTPTDSCGGNTYTKVGSSIYNNAMTAAYGSLWAAKMSGSCTPTITASGAAEVSAIGVHGAPASSPVDVSSGAYGASSPLSSGTITPTAQPELILVFLDTGAVDGQMGAQTACTANGYSNGVWGSGWYMAVCYLTTSDTAAKSLSATTGGSAQWIGMIAAVK